MKVFAVAAAPSDQIRRDSITMHFKNQGWGFWHWFPDFWILATQNDDATSEELRETVKTIAPGLYCMVLALDTSSSWAGFGSPEWKEWFDIHWRS